MRSQEEAATDAKKNLAFTIMALQDADVSEELLDQAEELYDEVRELDNRYNVEKAFEKVMRGENLGIISQSIQKSILSN